VFSGCDARRIANVERRAVYYLARRALLWEEAPCRPMQSEA